MKGHLSGLKSGDKVSASIKKSILTDLGHDESFVKTIGKSNLKLQKSIMKNKVVIDTASANRAGHISDHIKSHASNEVEEIAMTRFYQKYGSDMDVYDIRHTYPDFKAVERSGKETISATNRTSTTSTEYIGKVSGGGHTMEWTLDDPLTSYSSRRI